MRFLASQSPWVVEKPQGEFGTHRDPQTRGQTASKANVSYTHTAPVSPPRPHFVPKGTSFRPRPASGTPEQQVQAQHPGQHTPETHAAPKQQAAASRRAVMETEPP